MANLSEWLAVRLAAGEKQVIGAAAAARGLTTSAFVRELAVERSLSWLQDSDEARSDEEEAGVGV